MGAFKCEYAALFGGIDISKMTGRNLKTVGVQFKVALTQLMGDLASTKPHYVPTFQVVDQTCFE